MADCKNSRIPPGNGQDDYINKKNQGVDCGVGEDVFPYVGKCYEKSGSLSGDAYKSLCPYCSIWTSFPNGANLVVISIFECSVHGYGKRKEQDDII